MELEQKEELKRELKIWLVIAVVLLSTWGYWKWSSTKPCNRPLPKGYETFGPLKGPCQVDENGNRILFSCAPHNQPPPKGFRIEC